MNIRPAAHLFIIGHHNSMAQFQAEYRLTYTELQAQWFPGRRCSIAGQADIIRTDYSSIILRIPSFPSTSTIIPSEYKISIF